MKLPLLLFLVLLSVPVAAGEGEMVSGREYSSVLIREIRQAKKSVTACLFLFQPALNRGESETMRVADALAEARARGVKVEVVLDGSPDWDDWDPAGLGRNRAAYEYLSSKGVDVFFSTVPAMVHAKVVVFDEASVLAGSTNWSEAAFNKNVETNLLVRSPAAAREALAVIRSAGRLSLPRQQEAARLPAAILSARYARKWVRGRAGRAFDLYLLLLRESRGRERFSVSPQRLAELLSITVAPRDQVLRALMNLERHEGLIRLVKTGYGADPEIELVALEGDAVGVPADYWTFGWDKRLSMEGKVSFFLNKLRSERSPRRPRWSASLKTLVKEHGLSQRRIVDGTTELRRANLLEVEYDELKETGGVRAPNVYTPRSLYDPSALDRAWAELGKRFGEEKLSRARRCAALVYEDSDADVVERFIRLEESHGREEVEKIYRYIALKHPSNPRRTAAYFIAAIQKP